MRVKFYFLFCQGGSWFYPGLRIFDSLDIIFSSSQNQDSTLWISWSFQTILNDKCFRGSGIGLNQTDILNCFCSVALNHTLGFWRLPGWESISLNVWSFLYCEKSRCQKDHLRDLQTNSKKKKITIILHCFFFYKPFSVDFSEGC